MSEAKYLTGSQTPDSMCFNHRRLHSARPTHSQYLANPQFSVAFCYCHDMTNVAALAESAVGVHSGLILRVWEAVSSERSLHQVLEAAADVLVPVVPFASVGTLSSTFGGGCMLAAHIVGYRYRDGETTDEYMNRPEFQRRIPVPVKQIVAHSPDDLQKFWSGEPYMVADLLAQDGWMDHERLMAEAGIRAYTSVPLNVRGTIVGAAVFTRVEPVAFSPSELTVLKAASRALAVAVHNALTNDEIQRLRDELAAENIELKAQLGQAPWFEEIVGDSAPMRSMLARVEQVAATDATVLVTGETGTGKELIARAIHRRSRRAKGPLVKVNCAAIPETLLASELFGHERGAFTGAVDRRRGRFEQAHGGTIFLDEVGELPPSMQVTLLRVLQEREFERLGGTTTISMDARIVVATNRDLAADVRAGRFRSDLYYRLNVFPVHVPSLKERPEDVAPLTAHFVAKHGTRLGRSVTRVDPRALHMLTAYHWPGNVRELENVVERALILSRGGTLRIDREILPPSTIGTPPLADHLEASERTAIEAVLKATRGRVSGRDGAARQLDLPASTLEFRIRKLGIDKFSYRK
jgi:formate hydrogenlyase transcriptional activator